MNTRTQNIIRALALSCAGCLPRIEFRVDDSGADAAVEDGSPVDSAIDATAIDATAPMDATPDEGGPTVPDGAITTDARSCPRITRLALGAQTSCVVRANGALYCWGSVYSPFGGTLPSVAPQRVRMSSDGGPVSNVAITNESICTLHESGQVRCWGRNAHGEAGGSANAAQTERVQISGGATILASSTQHNCAYVGAALRCWGTRGDRRVPDLDCCNGEPTPQSWSLPAAAQPIASVSVSYRGHSFVTTTGQIATWGPNGTGQLSTGVETAQWNPTLVSGYTAAKIAMGSVHACIVNGANEVLCTGSNDTGAVGPSIDTQGVKVFTRVIGDERFVDVVVGGLADARSNSFTCALSDNRLRVRCWGDNAYGALGGGGSSTGIQTAFDGRAPIGLIAARALHVCVVDAQDRVYCWGSDNYGQSTGRPSATRDGGVGIAMPAEVTIPCD